MVERLCKEEDVGYVDLWDSFVGKEEMPTPTDVIATPTDVIPTTKPSGLTDVIPALKGSKLPFIGRMTTASCWYNGEIGVTST